MKKFTFLFLFFSLLYTNIDAQIDKDLDKLKSAYLNIQNEKYKEAYPYFKEVLTIYPKDPIYNYYVGRCLFFLEHEPSASIKYLRFAATKDVPEDVYYFLGRAYLNNYQFDKALESLTWFKKRAGKKQARELDIDNYISMAQNGLYLSKYVKKPLVYDAQKLSEDVFFEAYTFDELRGRFVDKYEYFHQTKDSADEHSVMFVPAKLEKDDVLYFSDRNKKRGDYDIYRIMRLSDSTWTEPENLGDAINTPFDENYPYLHSDGVTLYFASKGHYSMGAYDLYRSSWSWDTQQWSEPENLDFPINSPYDDILFVPSPNKKTAFFASKRETPDRFLMVYHLKLNSAEPYIETKNHEELLQLAKLKLNISPESEKGEDLAERNRPEQGELVKLKNKESLLYKTKYDSLLDLAIHNQLKADSLKWIIDDKRRVFDQTKESQARAQLSNVIIELERAIYSLQKEADRCYRQVREIEQANLASHKSIYEDAQKSKEPERNETNEGSGKKTNVFVEPVQDSIVKSNLILADEFVDAEDSVLDYGLRIEIPVVYHSQNPIPVNEMLPEGVLYMIQLGVFSSEKNPDVFRGLTPLSCIKNEKSTYLKYLAGKFFTLTEAEKNVPLARSKGFKDAFVVAFNNGKPLSVKMAVQLESSIIDSSRLQVKKASIDTLKTSAELSIIYVLKGQLMSNDSSTVLQTKASLPENAELYMEQKNGLWYFTIKSFVSYEEAFIHQNKLKAIIKSEIEIHAFFAENQIPLEQARKITK